MAATAKTMNVLFSVSAVPYSQGGVLGYLREEILAPVYWKQVIKKAAIAAFLIFYSCV